MMSLDVPGFNGRKKIKHYYQHFYFLKLLQITHMRSIIITDNTRLLAGLDTVPQLNILFGEYKEE